MLYTEYNRLHIKWRGRMLDIMGIDTLSPSGFFHIWYATEIPYQIEKHMNSSDCFVQQNAQVCLPRSENSSFY